MNAPFVARPRRSVLYVPGSNARAIDKARGLPADAVILDLEDAVLPQAKVDARTQVARILAGRPFGARETIVRINGLDTEWGAEDLAMVARSPADALLLPKVDSPDAVRDAAGRLGGLDAARPDMALWVMAETPRGIQEAERIVASSPRLAAVVMGTADLTKSLRLRPDDARTGLLAHLSHCVLAARAGGVDILDGIYTDLKDIDGFRASCHQGRTLGFDGKTLIHPAQIAAANEIFGISADEAAADEALIAAWEAAAAGGSGIAVVEGRMVERLHADEARRRVALYRAAAALSG